MGMSDYYIKKLEEELAFARHEVEQNRKDAERYRWLKANYCTAEAKQIGDEIGISDMEIDEVMSAA